MALLPTRPNCVTVAAVTASFPRPAPPAAVQLCAAPCAPRNAGYNGAEQQQATEGQERAAKWASLPFLSALCRGEIKQPHSPLFFCCFPASPVSKLVCIRVAKTSSHPDTPGGVTCCLPQQQSTLCAHPWAGDGSSIVTGASPIAGWVNYWKGALETLRTELGGTWQIKMVFERLEVPMDICVLVCVCVMKCCR